jgi:hypothetical protein
MNIPDDFIKNGYPIPLYKLQTIPEEEFTKKDTGRSIIINDKLRPKDIIHFQLKPISKIISLKFIYESV